MAQLLTKSWQYCPPFKIASFQRPNLVLRTTGLGIAALFQGNRKWEMEDELYGIVPCSSLAVDSILRVGTVWQLNLLTLFTFFVIDPTFLHKITGWNLFMCVWACVYLGRRNMGLVYRSVWCSSERYSHDTLKWIKMLSLFSFSFFLAKFFLVIS